MWTTHEPANLGKNELMTVPLRNLGNSTLLVSSVGMGCNNFGRPDTPTFAQDVTTDVLIAALDAGVTFWDTADIYGLDYGMSELLMGEVVSARRDEIVLATKFGHTEFESPIAHVGSSGSRAYIRAAVEGSLERLRTDYIDLYQHHTPDPTTPVEETLEALNELIDEGRVKNIGHTQYTPEQALHADEVARRLGITPFVSAQNEYSLLSRAAETGILPTARDLGLGFLPFFPLYNGLFTGKFDRSGGPADSRIMRIRQYLHAEAPWDAMDALTEFARARHLTMLEATIGWLLAVPGMSSVIAGVTSVEQIRENAAAATAWSPTPAEFDEISELFAF